MRSRMGCLCIPGQRHERFVVPPSGGIALEALSAERRDYQQAISSWKRDIGLSKSAPFNDASITANTSLLVRAGNDEQAAWDRLVKLYAPLVYSWCRAAGLQPADVADVAQEDEAAGR